MFHKSLVAIIMLFVMGGCANFKEKAYKDYAINDLTLGEDSSYRNLVKQLQATPAMLDAKCFSIPVSTTDQPSCGAQRNAAISALAMNSEKLCVDHRKTIYGNEATWNIASGTFANLFSGVASVTGSEATKSALSALALFSNSERSLVSETIYKTALIQAVDTKIVQRRNELALGLYNKFSEPIDKYSAEAALRDLVEFHYSCSFMEGLRLALEEGIQERAKQKIIRLRETLRLIESEINSIPIADRTSKTAEKYNALLARQDAVNKELIKLETQ